MPYRTRMAPGKSGISVVICTFNGSARLPSVLKSVIDQKFDSTLFELIVVDNASQDDTAALCIQALSLAQVNFNWQVVSEPVPGLNHARRKGLSTSDFEFVLFCDDDNILSEYYLKTGFEILTQNQFVGALGGCGVPSFDGEKPEWFDQYSHSFAVGPQSGSDGKLHELPAELYGAGTFFRRSPILSFFENGFQTVMSDRKGKSLASGGDVEWCYLVQLAGYQVWYDHRLTFEHQMFNNRMRWSYYLKLKEGIASGTGLLFSYVSVLKDPQMGILTYISRWLGISIFSAMLYFKHVTRLIFTRKPQDAEMELTRLIIKAKTFSYWRNGWRSLKHFRQLKRLS